MTEDGVVNIQFGPLGHNGNLEIYCRDYKTLKSNGRTLNQDTDFTYNPVKMIINIPFEGVTKIEITGVTSIFNVD